MAEVIAIKGHDVIGYDVVKKSNESIKVSNNIKDCVRNLEILELRMISK